MCPCAYAAMHAHPELTAYTCIRYRLVCPINTAGLGSHAILPTLPRRADTSRFVAHKRRLMMNWSLPRVACHRAPIRPPQARRRLMAVVALRHLPQSVDSASREPTVAADVPDGGRVCGSLVFTGALAAFLLAAAPGRAARAATPPTQSQPHAPVLSNTTTRRSAGVLAPFRRATAVAVALVRPTCVQPSPPT